MWPKVVVVPILAITSLVAPLSAQAGPELTPVSGEGDGFHLQNSVMVDGGENGNDEARGISVAADGTVFATVLYGCPTGTDCSPYEGDADWNQAGLYVITPEAVAATE